MAKKDGEKPMKLSEVMAALEEAYPEAGPEKLMKAAAVLMADEDGEQEEEPSEGQEGSPGRTARMDDDPYESESEEQMTARQSEEMAKCSTDGERADMARKHMAEKERFAKRIKGLEVQNRNEKMSGRGGARAALFDQEIARHPMVVKMAADLNAMRQAQARKTAETAVDAAIREGRLVPSQRDWAIEYCSADPQGFGKFIGAQPKIIQAGPDGTFTGRIGEAPADALTQRELMVCEGLGVSAEKFAAAKKARLSYGVTLG